MRKKLLALLVMLSLLVIYPQTAAAATDGEPQITPFWTNVSAISCGWSIDSSGYASGSAWSTCYDGYYVQTVMSLRQLQTNGGYIRLYSWTGPLEASFSYVSGSTPASLPKGYWYTMFVTATAYLNGVQKEQVDTPFESYYWQ